MQRIANSTTRTQTFSRRRENSPETITRKLEHTRAEVRRAQENVQASEGRFLDGRGYTARAIRRRAQPSGINIASRSFGKEKIMARTKRTEKAMPKMGEIISFASRKAARDAEAETDEYDTGMRLDLNHYLIKSPQTTYFVRVAGDTMTGAGIYAGDVLIVDRAAAHKRGSVIIALVNGELCVKRVRYGAGGETWLEADNPAYEPTLIGAADAFAVWGVVMYGVHRVASGGVK